MSFIPDLLDTIDTQIDHYTFDGYHAIASMFSTTVTTLLIIYFAGLGWLVIRGILPLTPLAIAWHMIKAAFIFALALHWDYFSYFCVDFFVHGTDRLVGVMLIQNGQNGDPEQITRGLAKIWESGSNVFADVWRNAGSDFLLGTLVGLIGYAAITGVTALALFYIVMSKIALSVLLILAPIILPMYLWRPTRGIFNSWLQILAQWMITPLLLYAFLGLYLHIIQTQIHNMSEATNGPSTAEISAFVLLAIIVMATFKQAGNMGRHLAKKIEIGESQTFGENIPVLAFRALRQHRS